ncbi:hypothetical protein B0H17DRAFT_1149323 [Mycena rosella]|uniref:Uncharacterized protein n=1 Tax=Mycena rosella TaxID=1033263 RepID=A0AAD7FT48_MYCRO|nr:hypothetical protein B0H17DRAFT_1149323 [Mycena rosella]
MQVVNEIAWASLGSLGKEEDKQGALGTSPRHSEIGRQDEDENGDRDATGTGQGDRREQGLGIQGGRQGRGQGRLGDRMGQRDRQEQGPEIQGLDRDKAGE